MKNPTSHRFWLAILLTLALCQDEGQILSNQPQCYGISRGKHFILGFTDNINDGNTPSRELSILVVAFNNNQQATSVTISSKHQVQGRPFQESFVVDAGGFKRVNIPVELTMTNTERSFKTLDISASSDVSAYGLMYQDYSTDGFLGIPTNNLGMQYVVVTPTAGRLPSHFAVIGTDDSTLVRVTLQGFVTFEGQPYNKGKVLSFVVNKLEAVQIQGTRDLTGSIIQADKPVAVFSGSECENNPRSACDTLAEQLVPVKSWGQMHIYTASQNTDNNQYYIVAYFSGTVVTIPGFANQTLDAGEFWEGILPGSGLVSSSKPALMMQQLASINGATVDPSLIQVPAEEQFGFVFGFTTPPHSGDDSGGYFNFISILVKKDSRQTVYLNGSPINGTDALPVREHDVPNTDYTSLTVPLPKGEGVYYVEQTERLSSPVSVIVYGYERSETYGYAAGLSLSSNKKLLSLTPYYLRELGGEMFSITVPCIPLSNDVFVSPVKCKFSTGIGDVVVNGDLSDPYTVVCITPTFYKNGLTSVYVSLDDGMTFPYSGLVYIPSEEDLPPLVNIYQMNSADGSGIIDLTSDDPIVFTWDPKSLGEGISHVTIMMHDSDYNSDGYPVLMEGVSLKSNVVNTGSLMVSVGDLKPLFGDEDNNPSLAAFYIIQQRKQKRNLISLLVFVGRIYSAVKLVKRGLDHIQCTDFKRQLMDVATGLNPCPCTSEQANVDSLNLVKSNFFNSFFHPGAKDCFRSTTSSSTGSGQQCCYGANGNILVGPPGGGTADRYSPGDHFWKHQWYDVLPWFACCKLSNNCDEYYKYRPSDDCSDYIPPRPAGGTGDPHITSLDGKKYTFNGAGEFLMASSTLHNFTFQSRMEVYRDTNASVYTAFVVQTNDSAKVQVQLSNMNETMILVDGEPLLQTSSPIRVHHLKGLRISFTPDLSEIRIAFSAGVAVIVYMKPEVMSFIAQLDTKFKGQIKGLLGNLNGDPDDDFQFQNGTIMNTNSSLEELHEFGLEWLVAEEDSIFTYLSPYDYNTYHFPEFSPIFIIPDSNLISQEIKDVCGNSFECLFDAVTTGSLSFANETLVVTGTIENIQKFSIKIVSCGFPGPVANGTISGYVYLENSTIEVTCDDGFKPQGQTSLLCQSDGQWSSDLPQCKNMKDEGFSPLFIALIVLSVAGLFLIAAVISFFAIKTK